MNSNHHRFTIGALNCMVVTDGTYNYPNPGQLLFANASPDELAPVLRAHNLEPAAWDVYVSPYPSLLIEHGDQRILVDMGAGNLAPTTGKLVTNLRAAGVAPEEIDLVFITHAHPDHIGGALDEADRPVFPNARYLLGRAEWDFWAADPDLLNLNIPDALRQVIRACPKAILPHLQAKMELLEPDTEIAPGLRAIAAPGHTPGQLALSVTSNGEQLLALTDVFIHPIHIEHPEWVAPFDYDAEATVATRRQLYEQAANSGALVNAGHLPWPCLGHIREAGTGWRWAAL